MRLLLLADKKNDLTEILSHTEAEIQSVSFADAIREDFAEYDAFCLLCSGKVLDPRLREKAESAAKSGKKIFVQYAGSFGEIYSAGPVETARKRLVYVGDGTVAGLQVGDLLDDACNLMMNPWLSTGECRPVLVYRDHLIAHTHTEQSREEILQGSQPGMWFIGENVLMTSFLIDCFNTARFAPREAWKKVILFIVKWLTGSEPERYPEPLVTFGIADADRKDRFEECRRKTIDNGIAWLRGLLLESGKGGIIEGISHGIHPDGSQDYLQEIRTDCAGETAGALRFCGELNGNREMLAEAENLSAFVYGPMLVKDGTYAGMMRWTASAWWVCYQDDVARAIIPTLLQALLLGDRTYLQNVYDTLDFLVATTPKDGCRPFRSDCLEERKDAVFALREEEHGQPSAHYNAYYHASLLLAYLCGGKEDYREVAVKGLDTLMGLYPDTKREQSETEEYCRLILPLSLLYAVTKEEKHREMLYRVAGDLQKYRHPFGGYAEWDTGYAAACSRNSTGECSVLSENGDPIADLLYSVNWLPTGFAMAYYVTKDEWFRELWQDICIFFMKTQMVTDIKNLNGAWTRAFDMNLQEAYANPHDVGWAANACETGWTAAEILMGMMLPDMIAKFGFSDD